MYVRKNNLTKMEIKKLPNRKEMRLQGYDYSSPGNYFITMVVQDKLNLFGHVVDHQMQMNEAGIMIDNTIKQISMQYDEIDIPYNIVMPNHVHLILSLKGKYYLGEIIRKFKSHTTHLYIEGVRNNNWPCFNKKLWQHNYFDHIIRNQRAYDYIANYIFVNPIRWEKDAINPLHDRDKDEIMKQVIMYG